MEHVGFYSVPSLFPVQKCIYSVNICSGFLPLLILYITCIMCKLNILFWTWNIPSDFIQQGVFLPCWHMITKKYHAKYLLPVGRWCPYCIMRKNLSKSKVLFTFSLVGGRGGSLGQNITVTLKQDAFTRWPTKIAGRQYFRNG